MKTVLTCAAALIAAATFAPAQRLSPAAEASVNISGKMLSVKYSAPSVRGRKIFGEGGVISHDSTYPVWRAGANAATLFHTDADLDIRGLAVPKGDYSLFVDVKDPNAWVLIVNKQTGQSGLAYDPKMDLGRVKMDMSKPAAPVEKLKYTLGNEGGNKGRLELAWGEHAASVPVTVK